MTFDVLTPIPDHVAFGDPDRRPRCAQGGPAIADMFTSDAAGAAAECKRICFGCPLGPMWPGDVCASWRRSHPEIQGGAVYGGRWFEGKLGG